MSAAENLLHPAGFPGVPSVEAMAYATPRYQTIPKGSAPQTVQPFSDKLLGPTFPPIALANNPSATAALQMEHHLRANMLQEVYPRFGELALGPPYPGLETGGLAQVSLEEYSLNELEAEAMLAVMAQPGQPLNQDALLSSMSSRLLFQTPNRKKTKFNTRLYKTELCRSWTELGYCPYGDSRCQFAHGKSELRPVQRHKKYKTVKCKNFLAGYCPYGSRCCFIHNQGPDVDFVSPSNNVNDERKEQEEDAQLPTNIVTGQAGANNDHQYLNMEAPVNSVKSNPRNQKEEYQELTQGVQVNNRESQVTQE